MDFFLTVFAIPFIVFPIFSGFPLGLMAVFNISVSVMLYVGYALLFFLFISIMLFFENRYNYLVRRDSETPSRNKKRAIIYILNYSIAIVCVVFMFTGPQSLPDSKQLDHLKLPCLPDAFFENPHFFKLSVNLFVAVPAIGIYCLVIWSQIMFYFFATFHYLNSNKAVSARTSQLQKKFFKTLCIQISVPFISYMIPCGYFMYTVVNTSVDMLFSIFGLVFAATHGLTSTVIMLVGHKPYREAAMEFFGMKQNNSAVGFIVAPSKLSVSNMK
ncbi:hypothetical protein CAEBREN_18624 [Caenorhabditis brenneri]|uniref:Serpentine Receptor, class H n=1 Tax=Caenorhabditis brenneri TaxID=135651 RepID=G0PB86_CAEBE|nr:hypothetical protein CAEBREN_18624 [Caenorhabditis brenneri]